MRHRLNLEKEPGVAEGFKAKIMVSLTSNHKDPGKLIEAVSLLGNLQGFASIFSESVASSMSCTRLSSPTPEKQKKWLDTWGTRDTYPPWSLTSFCNHKSSLVLGKWGEGL